MKLRIVSSSYYQPCSHLWDRLSCNLTTRSICLVVGIPDSSVAYHTWSLILQRAKNIYNSYSPLIRRKDRPGWLSFALLVDQWYSMCEETGPLILTRPCPSDLWSAQTVISAKKTLQNHIWQSICTCISLRAIIILHRIPSTQRSPSHLH